MDEIEMLAACKRLRDMLPPHKDVHIGAAIAIGRYSGKIPMVSVYPVGVGSGTPVGHFSGDTIAECFDKATDWCASYEDNRRASSSRS